MWRDKLRILMHDSRVTHGLVSAGSLAAGCVSGFLLARRGLAEKYAKISEKEIAEAKIYYAQFYKADEYSDPEKLFSHLVTDEEREQVVAAAEAMKEYRGHVSYSKVSESHDEATQDAIDEVQPEDHNVFTEPAPEEVEDFDVQKDVRDPDIPYVITHNEYYQNEWDFDQIDLVYFHGDNVLVEGSGSIPMQDRDNSVGEGNLDRFGDGSGDPNVVYICNEKHGVLYEITRSKGTFMAEVAGIIEHSDTKIRKMRRSYE